MTDSARFLEALFGRISGGCIEIRCFPPGRGDVPPTQTFIPQPALKEAGWSVDTTNVDAVGADVYVGVATRKDGSSGGRANTAWVSALYVDMDFKYGEEPCRKALAVFPAPPSIEVESGNGLHLYWLLKNPVSAQSPELALALRRLAAAFDGVADQGPSEPARVLRVPGTVNRKYDPPRPVRLAVCHTDWRYSVEELMAHCPEITQDPDAWTPPPVAGIPINKGPVLDMPSEFANRGLYLRAVGDKHYVRCPWEHAHTSPSVDSATSLFAPKAGGRTDLWGFKCLHDHCRNRRIGDVYRLWQLGPTWEDEPEVAPAETQAPPVDPDTWPSLFHAYDDFLRAKPLEFAIDGFLQEGGITYIGGLPGHGKTLIMLSIVRALLEGTPLFGHFHVLRQATRVLYLIPEAGISAFKQRLELFNLLPQVKAGRLFVRTLSIDEDLNLGDPRMLKAAHGADVFLDTAIRFMDGDENSSSEHREFAKLLFSLQKAGAKTIVGAHHSPKATSGVETLTLENVLRGAGDVGAMVATCWGVKQKDAETNTVYVANVKARDFVDAPCRPFEITGRPYLNEVGAFKLTTNPGLASAPQRPRKENPKIGQARQLRAAGMTQVKIAESLGVAERTVREWEASGKLNDAPPAECGF